MDYTTTLSVLARRAMEAVIDSIAKDGLIALKRILDESGFSDSQYLKDYSVYAHVQGDVVEFEILVSAESIEESPEVQKEMEQARKEAQEGIEEEAVRTYGLDGKSPVRIIGKNDARTPALDARTPARDVRKNAHDRLVEHEVAMRAPRSMSVNRKGKLSLRFNRSIRETSRGFEYPSKKSEGIVSNITTSITDVVTKKFVPELEKIILRIIK